MNLGKKIWTTDKRFA